jgi:hypothetical protein
MNTFKYLCYYFFLHILKCKYVHIILMALISNMSGLSQGVWDMNYVPVNLLNESYLGKEVRLDFKSTKKDRVRNNKVISIRKLLSTRDTFTLNFESQVLQFKENWIFYPYHGILSEQNLEFDKTNSQKFQIREIYINSISNSTITIQTCLYYLEKTEYLKYVCKSQIDLKISIDKNLIKGVLFRSESAH